MFKIKLFTIITIIFLMHCQSIRAENYYDNLPSLDGKVDGTQTQTQTNNETSNINTNIPSEESVQSKPEITTKTKIKSIEPTHKNIPSDKTNINKPGILEAPKDLALINAEKNPSSVLDANGPKLETPVTRFNNPDISDTKTFKEYMKDLNQITDVLLEIKKATIEGSTLQLLSAKVTNAGFLTEEFRNKYANGAQSKFETYKLVQEVVKHALYTKNFWLNSNKLTSNTRGMTDKILQTKLLQLNTEIDKLFNIINIQTTLTKE